MSTNDKKTHSIYLIDLNKVKDKLKIDDKKCELLELVKEIASYIINLKKGYEKQELKDNLSCNDYKLYFLFNENKKNNSNLSMFCLPFISPGELVLKFTTNYPSSIMFIWKDKSLFAITTGSGYHEIENFCLDDFGLIFATIFNKDFRVFSYKSNNLASIVRSSDIIYYNAIDFINIDNLDVFFRELAGEFTDKNLIEKYFGNEVLKKYHNVKLFAKNTVKFNISTNFLGLVNLIEKLDFLDLKEYSDGFNLFKPLNNKQNKQEIENLSKELIEVMYRNLKENSNIGFDIFNKDSENFLRANTYLIKKGNTILFEGSDYNIADYVPQAYEEYIGDEESSVETFAEFINNSSIISKNDFELTKGKLLNHVSGEINYNGNNYYIFYGKYYLQDKSYTQRLNETLERKIKQEIFTEEIKTPWKLGTNEDIFNERASLEDNFIHLHKKIVNNIEFADLMKFDEEQQEFIIVHVKDGFDNNMRQLERQLELSIRMIKDAKENNQKEFMTKLYDCAIKRIIGKNINSIFPTAQVFIDKLITCRYRYILVIRPKNPNLLESRSNIAKHCLNSIINFCNNEGITLKIRKI